MLIIITNPTTSDQIKKLRRFIDVEGYKNIVFERLSNISKTKKMISSSIDPIIIINDGKRGLGKNHIENICSKYDESICSSVHSLRYPKDESSLNALEDIISEYYESIYYSTNSKSMNKGSEEDAVAHKMVNDSINAAVEIEMRTANNSYDINEIWYRIRDNIISCLSDSMKDAEGGIDAKTICCAIAIAKKFIDKTNEEFSK